MAASFLVSMYTSRWNPDLQNHYLLDDNLKVMSFHLWRFLLNNPSPFSSFSLIFKHYCNEHLYSPKAEIQFMQYNIKYNTV